MLAQESLNAAVQLSFVLFVSFLLWVIFARKRAGFRQWIGLTLPTLASMKKASLIFLGLSVLTTLIYF
ncbi:MAG: hypothetical protein AAGA69_11610, partial [Pseudomonadota bacterium]